MLTASMQDFLDIKVSSVNADGLEATMPVTERTCQPLGILNGGASLALCEICASLYSQYRLQGSGKIALGAQVSANHLKSVPLGQSVRCVVKPVRIGSGLHVSECTIIDAKGALICKASVTCVVRPAASEQGQTALKAQ